jgi:hypothetical protein
MAVSSSTDRHQQRFDTGGVRELIHCATRERVRPAKGDRVRRRHKAMLGGLAGVLGAAAIRVAQALPLTEDAEPEHEYRSRMAKKKDSKKMGVGPGLAGRRKRRGNNQLSWRYRSAASSSAPRCARLIYVAVPRTRRRDLRGFFGRWRRYGEHRRRARSGSSL